MRLAHRLLTLGCGLLAAFAFAHAALAADTPHLFVWAYNTTPGATGDTEFAFGVPEGSSAPATVTIYVPQGYTIALPAAGTKIADAFVRVVIKSLSPSTVVPVQGAVTADDPAKYAADPAAQACAPGTHAGVWVVSVSAGG